MTAEGIVVYGKSKLLQCVIVALFVTIVALLSPSKKEEDGKEKVPTAYGIPKSPETVLYFQKGQRGVTVNLRTDQWSRVISTPTDPVRHVDYCIDVNPPIGFYVLFGDGRIEDVRADQKEVTNVGFCRGVFRLLGKSSDQTAVITISYR
ncbi:MAG: hypothetical protein AAB944_00880 [Patescibacteria group bacterium]